MTVATEYSPEYPGNDQNTMWNPAVADSERRVIRHCLLFAHMAKKRPVLAVASVLLVALATASIPVARAQSPPQSQVACQQSPELLNIDNAFDDEARRTVGATVFGESWNRTSFDAEDGTARIETAADSGRGLGAVGELGSVTFSRSWTAPCTGHYTFSVIYDLSVTVEQHREVSAFGNGVTRAGVTSKVLVGDVTRAATWETVEQINVTEWDSMIPSLEDLKNDALINYFSAIVEELLGVPVGEQIAEGAGLERDATDLRDGVTRTGRQISVSFRANEGDRINFLHHIEAGVIAASIGNGGSRGRVAVEVDVREATVSSVETSFDGGERDDAPANEREPQLTADTDAAAFPHSTWVDDATLGTQVDSDTGSWITRKIDGTDTVHRTGGESGTDASQTRIRWQAGLKAVPGRTG